MHVPKSSKRRGKYGVTHNNALSYHLRFFKDARTKELEEKRQSRGKVKLPDNFDSKFMEDYFKEWLLFV